MNNIRKFLLYFGIILLLFSFIFQYSTLLKFSEIFKNLSLFSGLFSLIISYMLKRKNNFILKILILFFLIIIYYFSKQTAIFELLVLMMAIEKSEVESIVKFCYKFFVVLLAIHIIVYTFSYIMGSSNLNTIIRVETNSVRHSFYFSHSNLFGTLCTWTYLSYMYINKNNLNKKNYLIGLLVIGFISLTCDSRTSAYVCLITILFLFFFKKINKKVLSLAKHSFCIIGIIAFALILLYPSSSFVQKIDTPQILHGRIKLGYIAYKYNLLSPFGNNISFFDNINLYNNYGLNSYTIDSTYYKMLFIYGYILTIGFMIYIERKASYIRNDDNFICFILAYSLSAFMESFAMYPFIFFPIYVLSSSDRKEELLYEEKR